jgi:hypothetical protein
MRPNADPDAHSRSGHVFFWRGSVVKWKHSKQKIIANSSAAAELIAMDAALGEAFGYMAVVREIYSAMRWTLPEDLVVTIMEDNQPLIDTLHAKYVQRLRHYAIKVGRVKELIAQGDIRVKHISGVNQLADGLTKAKDNFPFEAFNMSPHGPDVKNPHS